jgi:hypothetical protein
MKIFLALIIALALFFLLPRREIIVDSIRPGDTITSPVIISGSARGTWFFEADFPVELQDQSGKIIASGAATALSDWMTTAWVDFYLEMEFETEATTGYLVLRRSDPSGLHPAAITIPILYEN